MSRPINVSPLSYRAWLRLLFENPVQRTQYYVSNSTRLVEHTTRLCREFKSVGNIYSLEQINRGIWFLLSAEIEFGKYLADVDVAIEKRLECVRAMFFVYSDFVALSEVEALENCFYMWWDLLWGNFWGAHRFRLRGDEIMALMVQQEAISPEETAWWKQVEQILSQLKPNEDAETLLQAHGLSFSDFSSDESDGKPHIEIGFEDLEESEQQVIDEMLETLTKILYLDETRCEQYALHGLNHLQHPKRFQTVQQFIDIYSDNWDEETLTWLESCRDGNAM
jgi:hypothetical protein